MLVDDCLQNLLEIFLLDHKVDFRLQEVLRNRPVDKAEVLWNDLVENQTPERRINQSLYNLAVRLLLCKSDMNLRV